MRALWKRLSTEASKRLRALLRWAHRGPFWLLAVVTAGLIVLVVWTLQWQIGRENKIEITGGKEVAFNLVATTTVDPSSPTPASVNTKLTGGFMGRDLTVSWQDSAGSNNITAHMIKLFAGPSMIKIVDVTDTQQFSVEFRHLSPHKSYRVEVSTLTGQSSSFGLGSSAFKLDCVLNLICRLR